MLADITPKEHAKMDIFLSTSKTDETKHPVQAPVPGSGIATNKRMPQN